MKLGKAGNLNVETTVPTAKTGDRGREGGGEAGCRVRAGCREKINQESQLHRRAREQQTEAESLKTA